MPWNKGHTKLTHPSVMKTSRTMRLKKIDNFLQWRNRMKSLGIIPNGYPSLPHSGDLAEYIGVMLGDGNISRFPRTERIILVSNANNPGFIRYYAILTEKLFNKKPGVYNIKNVNAVRITLYQKELSKRLGIPTGNRSKINLKMQGWIYENRTFLIRFLKGLFEAEGSFSIHLPTSTYNLSFSNRNISLLDGVEKALILLGFHPERRHNAVRLRKRHEALAFEALISFRKYPLI